MDIKTKLIIAAIVVTLVGIVSIVLSVAHSNFWLALTIGGGVAFLDSLIAETYTKIY